MPHKPGTGAIRGIVSEDGFPARKRVTLLDRTNFRQLATLVSGVDGDYVFSGLDPNTDDYMLFSVDDDREPETNFKDPIIYDRVQPINTAMSVRQVNDWFYNAQKNDMRAAFVPILATSSGNPNDVDSGSGYGATRWQTIGSAQLDGTYLGGSPVLPQLGKLLNNNSMLLMYPLVSHSEGNYYGSPSNQLSLEWVIDLDNVTGNPALYFAPLFKYVGANVPMEANLTPSSTSGSDPGVQGYIGYISNRRTIQVGYNGSAGSSGMLSNPFSENLGGIGSATNMLEYLLPAELVGTTVHLIATIAVGSSTVATKLFVNGVKVAEKFLNHQRYVYTGTQVANTLILAGSKNADIEASYTNRQLSKHTTGKIKTSLAALYYKYLSEAEVQAQFNALFNTERNPIVPTESGYPYLVKMMRPFLYIPMSVAPAEDNSITVPQDIGYFGSFSQNSTSNNVKLADTSIVVGRSLLSFEGGSLLNIRRNLQNVPARNAVSFAWVAAPTTGTPSATEVLFRHEFFVHNSTYASAFAYHSWGLDRSVAGLWQIRYGSTITFDTPPEVGVQHHYAVTIDFVVGEAKLYVDGVLVEVKKGNYSPISPSANQVYAYVSSQQMNYYANLSIGSSTNLQTGVAQNFYNGVFGQFSAHPYLMTDREVEDMYDFLDVL